VNRSRKKRALGICLVAGLAASMLLAASPAHANGPSDQITIAGSDTTEFVMESILNTLPPGVSDPDGVNGTNVHNVRPGGANAPAVTVPGDGFCSAITFDPAEGSGQLLSDTDTDGKLWPPNGSSEGRNSLKQSADPALTYGSASIDTGNGCVDIARSSSAPSGSDPAEFEYYGFALDSVGWGTTSLSAPATLTLQQVRDIYNCAPGGGNDGFINDWADVGGSPGPIRRANAQAGSGTRAFFLANVLAGVTPPNGLSAQGCPDVVDVQESDGSRLLSSANEGGYNDYIVPYSAGKWVYQATNRINPTLDIRAGVRPGAITRAASETCPTVGALTFPVENDNPAYNIRWTGSGYLLNSATLICSVTVANGVTSGQGDSTVTAAAGSFTNDMIGLAVQGTNINDGTVVAGVSPTGDTLTITPGAKAGGTASLSIGISVVNEQNPNIGTAANKSIYPGVRMLFNVIDSRQGAASYDAAKGIVGFNTGGGTKSGLCDGANVGEINDNGFLDLAPVTQSGTVTTCRLR
jgi:phosphate transport system substrate-binding protein